MASTKIEKGSEEWMFFMDFWKFHQDYYRADNCDDWYVEMMNAGEKLIEKYSKTEFSMSFSPAFIISTYQSSQLSAL